jgi:hypothetical protein
LPFFHESGISLKFIDLSTSYLLPHFILSFQLIFVENLSSLFLSILFQFKFFQMGFHVKNFLWFVKYLKSLLEEYLSVLIILLLWMSNFKCWLIITHLSSYKWNDSY